jgi:NaMN:DMB phosphoribosyltransferase
MLPAFAGLVLGAARVVPVLLAGGTQMGAALAIIKALDSHILKGLAIATTRWVVEDSTSDLRGIVGQIADVPVLAVNLDFSQSRFEGLRAYEKGVVKEGVGAGGACIAAMLKSGGKVTPEAILEETEANYKQLIGDR